MVKWGPLVVAKDRDMSHVCFIIPPLWMSELFLFINKSFLGLAKLSMTMIKLTHPVDTPPAFEADSFHSKIIFLLLLILMHY